VEHRQRVRTQVDSVDKNLLPLSRGTRTLCVSLPQRHRRFAAPQTKRPSPLLPQSQTQAPVQTQIYNTSYNSNENKMKVTINSPNCCNVTLFTHEKKSSHEESNTKKKEKQN